MREAPIRMTLRSERGATLFLVAVAMVALLTAVAIAIDIGMLLSARTEAQRVADAAALAGAGELHESGLDVDAARDEAIAVGGQNTIVQDPAQILDEDVEIDLDEGIVRVTARRLAARGNALPTWFANIFGVSSMDVSAVAAAAVIPAGGSNCVKPWTIMDGFRDDNLNGVQDPGEPYEGFEYGTAAGSTWRNANIPNPDIAPYNSEPANYVEDQWRPIKLHAGDPKDTPVSGWWYPFDITGPGGRAYRDAISTCTGPVFTSVSDDPIYYHNENGRMVGPTNHGMAELFANDPPGTHFDPTANGGDGGIVGCDSPCDRIVYIPFFHPSTILESGKKTVWFPNIGGFFLEEYINSGPDKGAVIGRFMHLSGLPGGSGSTLLVAIRLVE